MRIEKMKIYAVISLLIVSVVFLSSCASIQKKFTRRSKPKEYRREMIVEKDFVKPYSNEYYYSNHFNMWKIWQEELIDNVAKKGNAKKRDRVVSELRYHLQGMNDLLVDEKQKDLKVHIDNMDWALQEIERGNLGSSKVKSILESSLRMIRNGFYTNKMTSFIKPDEIPL